ncbi:argininosuccinate lyase [Pseudomonas fluorescens]|uniref:argininosuccinate lyase n=1 Tax=Pseudomonas fluorescens TaxID=294 RepID=UPI003D04FAE3
MISPDPIKTAASAMAAIGATMHFDWRLAGYDLQCSQAHVEMLHRQNIICEADASTLLSGLEQLSQQVRAGEFMSPPDAEDIHTALELQLEALIGPVAGWLGTARARNDLAVTALKLWLRDQIDALLCKLKVLLEAFRQQALRHAATVMPGYSHLQVAQPITFGHLNLAYAETLLRDGERLLFARASLRECPLGSAALAGTSFAIDRIYTAQRLGFECPSSNSIDSVGERGFALDFLTAASSLALNLSRFAAEVVFWSTQSVGFIVLPNALVSGSAAMPHKRNPDAAELIRAKSGRVLGNLQSLQVVVKGLPLTYFRDLQEDKEPLFDTADSLHLALDAAISIVSLMQPQPEAMLRAASIGFITSSDLADWLVINLDIPFREAHHLVARLVESAQSNNLTLGELSLELRSALDPRLAVSPWPSFNLEQSVHARRSYGGTAPERVTQAAEAFVARLNQLS